MDYADMLRQYRRRNRIKAVRLIVKQKHDISEEYHIKGKNCSRYFWYPKYLMEYNKNIKKGIDK